VPLGFCSGGFSSTDGYVPVNEAQNPKVMSDFCIPLAVPFRWVLLVFIQVTQENLSTFFSKPFGFNSKRYSNFFPLKVTLK